MIRTIVSLGFELQFLTNVFKNFAHCVNKFAIDLL